MNAMIHGRVQGVSFRYFVKRLASNLGATGWVKNEPDGTVSMRVEGSKDTLELLLKQVRKGPPLAQVTQVDVAWDVATNEFKSFEIKWL